MNKKILITFFLLLFIASLNGCAFEQQTRRGCLDGDLCGVGGGRNIEGSVELGRCYQGGCIATHQYYSNVIHKDSTAEDIISLCLVQEEKTCIWGKEKSRCNHDDCLSYGLNIIKENKEEVAKLCSQVGHIC